MPGIDKLNAYSMGAMGSSNLLVRQELECENPGWIPVARSLGTSAVRVRALPVRMDMDVVQQATSTIEGGAGAQIGCVPEEQNSWQGTYWSSWLAEARASGILKPGGKFRVKLGSFDCGTFTGKRDLHKRTKSPILSSANGMTVIASTAFGNLSNGTNAVIVPLTPDPEFGYPGKYTVDYSLTDGALASAYIMDDSGEPFETLPSLQDNGSNTTTFTIDDEGAGNVWLLGWTRSENPKLNVSVKAPAAPTSTSFASAAATSATATRSSSAAAVATTRAVSEAAEKEGVVSSWLLYIATAATSVILLELCFL
ncbi:MAG: hypothetical protein LQ352_006964 [Teloschistes flavicans]|nr:MAG: hypothetical protein LQ352_006964 [Teloschistes flavicans]